MKARWLLLSYILPPTARAFTSSRHIYHSTTTPSCATQINSITLQRFGRATTTGRRRKWIGSGGHVNHLSSRHTPQSPYTVVLHASITQQPSSSAGTTNDTEHAPFVVVETSMDTTTTTNSTVDDTAALTLHNGTTASTTVATSPEQTVPSYLQLLKFCLSTVMIWLTEPLLSLVDTTVVGWSGTAAATATAAATSHTVLQMAALGPATTLYDSWLYLTYFLSMATTNKLTAARARRDARTCLQTTSHVLGVAVVLGLGTTVVMWVGAKFMLARMMGHSVHAAKLVPLATKYIAIRALVAVASVVGMVCQSICLSTLDTKTPIRAVLAASVVNLVGDLALRRFGMQGVAVATAVSSVVSSTILARSVRKQCREWRRELAQQKTVEMSTSNEWERSSTTVASNSTVADHSPLKFSNELPQKAKRSKDEIPLLSLPDRKSFWELVRLSGPIFFVILAKTACYSAVTLRTARLGVITLAAHNIMMRIFFFFGTFGDAMSQTAQSFLPTALYPTPNPRTVRILFRRLAILTAVIALLNSQVSLWLLYHCGPLLTKDTSIVQAMRGAHSQFMGLSMLVHPFSLLLEGTVLALRQFGTLVWTYAFTVLLHFGVLAKYSHNFGAVWRTFFLFQSSRLLNFGWQLWRRRDLAMSVVNGHDDKHAKEKVRK